LQLRLQAVVPKHHGKDHTFYFSGHTVVSSRGNKLVLMKFPAEAMLAHILVCSVVGTCWRGQRVQPSTGQGEIWGYFSFFLNGHRGNWLSLLLGAAYIGCGLTFRHGTLASDCWLLNINKSIFFAFCTEKEFRKLYWLWKHWFKPVKLLLCTFHVRSIFQKCTPHLMCYFV